MGWTTNQELLKRIEHAWGDSDAWQRLLGQYWPLLHGQLAKRGFSRTDADDVVAIVEDKLLHLMKHFTYDPKRHFRGLIGDLMRKSIVDFFRQKAKIVGVPAQALIEAAVDRGMTRIIDDVSEGVDRDFCEVYGKYWEVEKTAIDIVRSRSGANLWHSYYLHVGQGMKAKDVAIHLGIKEKSVITNCRRFASRVREEFARLKEQTKSNAQS